MLAKTVVRVAFGLILSLLLINVCIFAQPRGETITLNDLEQFKFAEYLLSKKDYNPAILEYKKLVYFFPTSPLIDISKLRIGSALYFSGNQLQTISYLNSTLSDTLINEISLLNRLRYQLAISLFDAYPSAPFYIKEDNIEKAFQQLQSITELEPFNVDFEKATQVWRNRNKELKKKTPWLAGAFSAIIPGLGSVYSNRIQEGAYSFFIVAMFSFATIETYQENSKNRSLNPLLFLLTAGFYAGSIYTAVNSTYLYNSEQELNYLSSVRDQHNLWWLNFQ